jgi:hypothetical protein
MKNVMKANINYNQNIQMRKRQEIKNREMNRGLNTYALVSWETKIQVISRIVTKMVTINRILTFTLLIYKNEHFINGS